MIFLFIWQCLSIVTGDLVGSKLILKGPGEITSEIVSQYTPTLVKSIEILDGPSIIGQSAFALCTNLQEIKLSDSIKIIKAWAFQNTQLKTLHIPAGVEEIHPEYLFYASLKTEMLKVEETNTKYAEYDRCIYDYNKTKLILVPSQAKNISIYEGTTTIGTWSLYYFSDQNLIIPDSVRTLESQIIVDSACSGIVFSKNSNLARIPSDCFWQAGFKSFLCPPKVEIIEKGAFYTCKGINSFDVMEGSVLHTVESQAFYNNENLVSVRLPSTVTELSADSFTGCSSLTKFDFNSPLFKNVNGTIYNKDLTEFIFVSPQMTTFTVETEIKKIGQSLFQRCENLTELNVTSENANYFSEGSIIYQKDNNVAFCAAGGIEEATIISSATGLADSIFRNLKKLKKVTFQEVSHCTSFGSNAFALCSELVDVELPPSLQTIDIDCFQQCNKITKIVLPRDLFAIYNRAFSNLKGLTSITYAPGCKLNRLGITVFGGLQNLQILEIPNSLQNIVESTFAYCGISSLHIPSGTVTISNLAFESCPNLEELIIDEDSKLSSIGSGAFQNCPKLELIKIPSNLLSIASAAFSGCKNLKEIRYLGVSQLQTIGSQAFEATQIENFTITKSVQSISPTSFAKCSKLTKFICTDNPTMKDYDGILFDLAGESLLIVPAGRSITTVKEGTKRIESQAMYYCTELKSLTFESPCEVSKIGKFSFYQCSSLTEIAIPSSVSSIEEQAFVSCDLLSNVCFDEGSLLETLKSSTFLECKSLQYVTFSGECSLHTIDSKAFYGLPLKLFEAPKGVKVIGESAFSDCAELHLINLSLCNELNIIPNQCFESCSNLLTVVLPQSIKSIGEDSFKGCKALSEIDIPEGTVNVSAAAFMRSGLQKISLGLNIERIGEDAFASCEQLVSVNITGHPDEICENAFGSCPILQIVLYCGDIPFQDVKAFSNSNNNLVIYVLHDYRFHNFCGRAVERVMHQCGIFPTHAFTVNLSTGLAVYETISLSLILDSNEED